MTGDSSAEVGRQDRSNDFAAVVVAADSSLDVDSASRRSTGRLKERPGRILIADWKTLAGSN